MGEIIISNRMTAKYKSLGYHDSNVDMQVTVGTYIDSDCNFEVSVRANKSSRVNFETFIMFARESSINFDVQPYIVSKFNFDVEVNPHNRMAVLYELVEPPVTIHKSNPVQDTFTTEDSPYNVVNYGNSLSMKVGQDDRGENNGYMQFDVSDIPSDAIVKSAKLRVYYSTYNNQAIDIYRLRGAWSEYGLTYNNANSEFIPTNSTMIVNDIDRYLEFDVSETVIDWISGVTNNGFGLKSLEDVVILRTREYSTPPELIITYFDDKPYSADYSRIPMDLIVRVDGKSTVLFDAFVKSDFNFDSVFFDVYAHQPDIPLLSDINFEIYTNEYIKNDGISDVDFEVTVTISSESNVNFEVDVKSNDAVDNVLFEVTVGNSQYTNDNSNIDFEVIVSEYNNNSDINFELVIIDKITSDINFEVEVSTFETNSDFNFEISVQARVASDVLFDVLVPQFNNDSDILFEMIVPVRNELSDRWFEIGVIGEDVSNINFDVLARVPFLSEVLFEVEIVTGRTGLVYVYMI